MIATLCLLAASIVAQVAPFIWTFGDPKADGEHAMPELPGGVAGIYSSDDAARAETFNRPLAAGRLGQEATIFVALLAVVLSGVAVRVESRHGTTRSRWPARFLFLVALYAALYLFGLPFRAFNFAHLQAFGLSQMSFGGWLRIMAIRFPIRLSIFVLKYALVFCAVNIFRRAWPLAAALLLLFCFGLVPEFLRNRPAHPEWELRELEASAHREEMEAISRAAGFDLDFMVSDHSRRASTVNMYLCGHAAGKYVLLTDTFLGEFTPREAGVALAHELGHHRYNLAFTLLQRAMDLLQLVIAFFVAQWLCRRASWLRHGVEWAPLQVVPVAALSLWLIGTVAAGIENGAVRWEEGLADRYALELTRDGEAFASVLLKGAKINLERLEPPRWQNRLFGDHASVRSRIENAREFLP